MKRLLPFISLLLTLYYCLLLRNGWYSPFFILFWVLSIILLLISFVNRPVRTLPSYLLPLVLTAGLVLVRVIHINPDRIHLDEALVGYFSMHYSVWNQNFFSGIPQNLYDWPAKFPVIFFVFQKLFLSLFSSNYFTLKLSVLPYIAVASLALYGIAKTVFNTKTAVVSLIIYAFLANSLYFETLGLITVTGQSVYLVFLFFLIKWIKKNTPFNAVATGISCAFCYLFYLSSYIALPVLLVTCLLFFKRNNKINFLKSIFLCLFAFWITFAPFFTYAMRFENYFLGRFSQIYLFSGNLSAGKNSLEKGESSFNVIKNNTSLFIKSISNDGVGGSDGFDFSHLALFEPFTRYFLILSLIVFCVLSTHQKERFLVLISLLFCIFSVIFSTPPPGIHRLNIAYSLLALIFSSVFYVLFKSRLSFFIKFLFSFILIVIFIRNNYLYFLKTSQDKLDSESIKLSKLINTTYPNRHLFIASFPGFAFEKIYYFSDNKKALSIKSDYHRSLLGQFNSHEKYVYVIIFPESFDADFQQKDPKGKIVKFSPSYHLFIN